jgi:hypothetical protein
MNARLGLGALGIVALPVLCCGLTALLAAGGLAVIGAWLGAHGLWVAGGATLAVAAAACGRWWVLRRGRVIPAPPTTVVDGR